MTFKFMITRVWDDRTWDEEVIEIPGDPEWPEELLDIIGKYVTQFLHGNTKYRKAVRLIYNGVHGLQ